MFVFPVIPGGGGGEGGDYDTLAGFVLIAFAHFFTGKNLHFWSNFL